MSWQNFAEAAATRYITDAAVRELVLAEIRGVERTADFRPRSNQIVFQAVRERGLRGLFEQRWPA